MKHCVICGAEAHAIARTVVKSMRRAQRGEVVEPIGTFDDPVCFDNDRCQKVTKKFKGLVHVRVGDTVIFGQGKGSA